MNLQFKAFLWILFIPAVFFVSCQSTTYYVDNNIGNDSNNGKKPEKAWATIKKVNSFSFQAGDKILFHGDQTFEGTIFLDSTKNGTENKWLTISSFGDMKAVISGLDSCALIAKNCNNLIIKNLIFKGSGRKNGNTSSGLLINEGSNILIDSLDVSGFQKSGVDIRDAEDVKITHVHAFENGIAGIYIGLVYYNPFKLVSKNIYIAYCTTENNPGDPTILTNHSGSGIIVSGTDGAIVEYCLAKNNGWDQPWEGNGPIGIWAFHSNNVLIQNCISHSNKSNPNGWDGGGFDFDGGMTNSIMQYNLSYNNAGPGYGLYQYWGAAPWGNNIVRYNISFNDGTKNDSCALHVWNGQPDKPTFKNALIYNNVFYNDFGRAVDYKSGDVSGLYYWNNILVSKQEPVYGVHSKSNFENNLYWKFGKEMDNRNEDSMGIFDDPKLILPNLIDLKIEDPLTMREIDYFKLLPGSPCIGKGKIIPQNGNFDFWRNPVSEISKKLNIGAWQSSVE